MALCSFKPDISLEFQTSKNKANQNYVHFLRRSPEKGHQDRTRVFPFVFSNVPYKREIKFKNVNDQQKWFSKICVLTTERRENLEV
jgi:hypothetical protein